MPSVKKDTEYRAHLRFLSRPLANSIIALIFERNLVLNTNAETAPRHERTCRMFSAKFALRAGVSPSMHRACDDDLEWFLCQAAGLLGQRSGHGAFVAVLEGGGSGAFDSSAAEALVERARPHVARARRLGAIWAALDATTKKVLTAHYAPQAGTWGPGVRAMLGDVAGVALLQTKNRARLELACCHGTLAANQAVIVSARGRAQRAVARAHRMWRDAKDASMIAWARG